MPDPGHRPDLMAEQFARMGEFLGTEPNKREAEGKPLAGRLIEEREYEANLRRVQDRERLAAGQPANDGRPLSFDEQLKGLGADVVRGQRYAMALAIQLDGQAKQLEYTAGMLRQLLEPGDLLLSQLNQSAQRLLSAMEDVQRALRGHQL